MLKVDLKTIMVASAVILTACQPGAIEADISAPQNKDSSTLADNIIENVAVDTRGKPLGALPKQAPIPSVAVTQNAVIDRLLNAKSILRLDDHMESIYEGVGGVTNNGLKWRGAEELSPLYLVVRHLEKLPKEKLTGVPPSFCETGEIYTGYAAAGQSLSFWVESEVGTLSTWAIPHGLIICASPEQSALKIGVMPIRHEIFSGDEALVSILDELPEHHPLSLGG